MSCYTQQYNIFLFGKNVSGLHSPSWLIAPLIFICFSLVILYVLNYQTVRDDRQPPPWQLTASELAQNTIKAYFLLSVNH